VPPDQEVLAACDRLQRQGYAVALDDCLNDGRTAAFAPFVDILKVDFQLTSPANQLEMAQRYRKLKIKMLAEKVETESEFRRAQQSGYDYFQGYFFARPTVMQAARLPASQATGLRLIKQIQREEMDFDAVADLIQHDVGLSHSLLRYLNSAAFHWADRVESIRRGLNLLGEVEIRKWAWMASLSGLGQNRPQVLMAQVMMRGRFCEAIARAGKLSLGNSDPFLLGMFSLLDAILQRPLAGILSDLNIGPGICNALLGKAPGDDILTQILRVVRSYEVGDWRAVTGTAKGIGLSAEVLGTCYLESLAWVESVTSADEPAARPARPVVPAVFHRTPRPIPGNQPAKRQ